MMNDLPCEPDRRVIDVSGDGDDNDSDVELREVRDRAAAEGIVINGLPIVTATRPYLARYFEENVITPGGFVINAEGFSEVGRALTKKLVHEIAEQDAGRRRG